MKKILAVVFIFAIQGQLLIAQHKSQLKDSLKFLISLPLLDYPFNFSNGYHVPSMAQALETSKSFYETSIYGMDYTIEKYIKFNNRWLNLLTESLINIGYYSIVTYLPLGDSWLHEEYHRAVLQSYNIKSHDDVYDFRFFSPYISVSHVKDSDLIMLKKDHPRDFIRLNEAGYEGQNDLVLALEKDNFYYNMSSSKVFINLYNILNNILYLRMCSTTEADAETDQFNEEDGKDISVRDFTGLDFTAWVYDLFRPDEPYQNRGIHPSGVGIDRYIKYSDLTDEEKSYLKKQGDLSLLSLIDPMLFGIESFTLKRYSDGSSLKFNANIKHYLTPSGSSINLNVFIKKNDFNLFVSFLNQFNYVRHFSGFELSIIDFPDKLFNKTIYLTPRLMMFWQPTMPEFQSAYSMFGDLFSLGLDYPLGENFRLHFETEWKSFGWVAGNASLDQGLALKFGVKGLF